MFPAPHTIVARYLAKKAEGEEEPSGKGGVPPQWNEWLKEEHQGGKQKVSNPNPETKGRFPQVSYSTALKDKNFHGKALEEFKKWRDKDKGKSKKEGPSQESETSPGGTSLFGSGTKVVGNVTYKSELTERNKAGVQDIFRGKMPSMEDFHTMFGIPGDAYKTEVRVKPGVYGPSSIGVFLDITDGDTKVGTIHREFVRDADEDYLEVIQELFQLDDSAQGKGVGTKVLSKSFKAYKDMGVSRVSQTCAWVGRYTWARMGYTVNEKTLLRMKSGLSRYLTDHHDISSIEARDWVADNITSLSDIADLHLEDGSHVGKDFLLKGGVEMYNASLDLKDGDPGYERMQAYLEGKKPAKAKPLSTDSGKDPKSQIQSEATKSYDLLKKIKDFDNLSDADYNVLTEVRDRVDVARGRFETYLSNLAGKYPDLGDRLADLLEDNDYVTLTGIDPDAVAGKEDIESAFDTISAFYEKAKKLEKEAALWPTRPPRSQRRTMTPWHRTLRPPLTSWGPS